MFEFKKSIPASLFATALLTACGGGEDDTVPVDPTARAEVLMRSERGMQSISLDAQNAYLSLTNTATEGSAVLRTGRTVLAASAWQPVSLGPCGLPTSEQTEVRRAPQLKQVAGKTLLMQPAWGGPDEHTLCELSQDKLRFAPKDKDFNPCIGGYCEMMEVDDVQAVGQRLFANAGGAPNLQVSNDQGMSWPAILGSMEGMRCTNQAFHLVGNRMLVGGECPLDMAYLRAYQMKADNSDLASPVAIALGLPELQNRNVHFITSRPNSERVFVGVEGGLLRSEDGGRTFKFVFQQPVEGPGGYVYITKLLSPARHPNVIVVSGFDKAKGLPFLAWSSNNGDQWIDLSSLLPGYKRTGGEATSQVTSMAEDAQGRILLTVNEEYQAKGRLVAVKLGRL